jgi:hypothetical protein
MDEKKNLPPMKKPTQADINKASINPADQLTDMSMKAELGMQRQNIRPG